MNQAELRNRLQKQFDSKKLAENPAEWAFTNLAENQEVKAVGYATNISPAIALRAAAEQVDVLVTHHDAWDFVYGLRTACEQILTDNNIGHGFFHGVLDDADFGTSAALARQLGVENPVAIIPYGEGLCCGRSGSLDEKMMFADFVGRLERILKEPVRKFQNHNRSIKKLCVTAGGGNMTTDMKIAAEMGCDTYITGEYSLYSQQYAELVGMNLFVGSHTNTEIFGVEQLVQKALADADVRQIRIFEENY